MTAKRKPKNPDEPYLILYKAVCDYVESYGGKVAVCGGIQVQEWPADGPYQFTIAIKCTGRKPAFKEQK